MVQTIKGEKGEPGQNGQNGVDGSQIFTGTNAPATSVGKTGDIYINTSTWDFYKKNGSTWSLVGNLKGSDGSQGNTGPQGPQGQPGQNGTCVRTGNGAPLASLGVNGDSYIDLSTWNYYVKQNNTWILKGNIRGDNGQQGLTGVSVISTVIDQNGDLIVEFSNGESVNAGHIVDTQIYTVTFHVDDEVIATRNVIKGNTVDRPSSEEVAGYRIHGWYTIDGEYQTIWNFQGCVVTSNIDLWASFDYKQYTINFCDYVHGFDVPDMQVFYDKEYTLPQLSKTGYTFLGWRNNDDWKIIDNTGIYRFAKDICVDAVWNANKYTVSLDANGGMLDSDSVEVIYNTVYTLPTPVKTGYTFTGWYENETRFSSSALWDYDENKSLVASWTNVSMTFTFDAGDGVCPTESMVILYGEEYTLPEATRNGYFFGGWKLNNQILEQTGIWTYSTEGAILIAIWIETYMNFSSDGVTFGRYPNSQVTNQSLIDELNELTTADKSGWYTLDGKQYAKVVASRTQSLTIGSFTVDFTKGETYWFLVEPIFWRKFSSSDGKHQYISSIVLDRSVYYAGDISDPERWDGTSHAWANSYAYSDLRKFLIDDFYNKAFPYGKEYLTLHEMTSHTTKENSVTINDYVFIENTNQYSCSNTAYTLCRGATSQAYYWCRSIGAGSSIYEAYYTATSLTTSYAKNVKEECGVRPSIVLTENVE